MLLEPLRRVPAVPGNSEPTLRTHPLAPPRFSLPSLHLPPQLGEYGAALADYQAALALDPSSSYAHYNAGIVRDRLGQYQAAVDCFTAAVALEPRNADFRHVRPCACLCVLEWGQWGDVDSSWPAGWAAAGPVASAWHDVPARLRPLSQNRGFSLRKMERYEEAIRDYTAAVQLDPGHTKALYNRAVALERLRRHEAAAEDYGAVLERDPSNAPARQNRGCLLLRLGRLEEAVADLTAALQADSGAAAAWHARGEARERLGASDAALADLQR